MPEKFAVLGDIHAAWNKAHQAIAKNPGVLIRSVGDMGFGFPYEKRVRGRWVPDPSKSDPAEFPPLFKFIRGNHDSPEVCRQHPNYLGDYGVDPETGIFFISGAFSGDQELRTPGLDWWEEEELTLPEAERALVLYGRTKPRIVLSHDCPLSLYPYLNTHHKHERSRTAQLLQAMFEFHAPDLWVFGHHHKTWKKAINGTRFHCAAINQVLHFGL